MNTVHTDFQNKIPVIYSDDYNIHFFGFEKLHPFDTGKYRKAYNYLRKNLNLSKSDFYKPDEISENLLYSVHTKEYISSLKNSSNIARIAEMPVLQYLPSFILNSSILRPMRIAAGGSVLAADLALKKGIAINLSGGYHHAKSDGGGGFCFYSDIAIAVHSIWQKNNKIKVLIVDLDAHQGNGHEAILGNDPRVDILDIYNKDIYPGDKKAEQFIDFNYPVPSRISETEYITIVENSLEKALLSNQYNLLIYNAGTDIYKSDPLGQMNISEAGIIKRDDIVFSLAQKNSVPILILLSGGYTKESGLIIGKSIENLIKKNLKNFH